MLYSIDPVTNAPTKIGLEVSIAGNPTGQVFNGNSAAFNGDAFIFASEDGSISGWRGALGTTAEILQPASADNVYKGLATAQVGGHSYLYAADFLGSEIDVVKGDAGAPDLTGKFVDPTLPAGYAPFNVQTIGDRVYITYALQNADGDEEVPGVGLGFVNVFDTQGNFISRVGSDGMLNAPWGLALGPSSFGDFAGDLFVGNFGDGRINIFDLATNTFIGQLLDIHGNPIAIDGLWALTPGNDGRAGSADRLYLHRGSRRRVPWTGRGIEPRARARDADAVRDRNRRVVRAPSPASRLSAHRSNDTRPGVQQTTAVPLTDTISMPLFWPRTS